MFSKRKLVTLCIVGICLMVKAVQSHATLLTPTDKNFTVLIEVMSQDLGALGVFNGADPNNSLIGSGTFDSNGWNWSISSSYLDVPLVLSYSGTYDSASDTINWNGSGNYGTDPWTSSGTVVFLPNDTATLNQLGRIGTATDEWGITAGLTFSFGGGKIVFEGINSSGFYNGKDANITQKKAWNPSTGDWTGQLNITREIDQNLEIGIGVQGKGTGKSGVASTVIVIKSIPEPPTAFLFCVGVFLLGIRRIFPFCRMSQRLGL